MNNEDLRLVRARVRYERQLARAVRCGDRFWRAPLAEVIRHLNAMGVCDFDGTPLTEDRLAALLATHDDVAERGDAPLYWLFRHNHERARRKPR